MSNHTVSPSRFSLGQARGIVKDLFTPNPTIYWADFLLSLAGGGICFVLNRRVFAPLSLPGIIAFVVCGLCYYRAVLFIHELVHMRDKSFRNFSIAWNLMCGIPFLMPTFLYYTHVDHHRRKNFGTHDDGEYLPLGTQSPLHIVVYMCQALVLPVIAVVRFLVLTPLSLDQPRVARIGATPRFVDGDGPQLHPAPADAQDDACVPRAGGAVLRLVRGRGRGADRRARADRLLDHRLTFWRSLSSHSTLCARWGPTAIRTRASEMTFVDQLLDSINYPKWPLVSGLWAPVGLRFHALHHLFPSMPYHNLATAHARLMAELPADSPYRLTESSSLLATIADLWRRSRLAGIAADEARCHEEQPRPRRTVDSGRTLSGAH